MMGVVPGTRTVPVPESSELYIRFFTVQICWGITDHRIKRYIKRGLEICGGDLLLPTVFRHAHQEAMYRPMMFSISTND
jgi:hypothetical protein